MTYFLYLALGGALFGAVVGLLVSRSPKRALRHAAVAAIVLPATLAALIALPGTFEYAAETGILVTAVVIFLTEGRLRRR